MESSAVATSGPEATSSQGTLSARRRVEVSAGVYPVIAIGGYRVHLLQVAGPDSHGPRGRALCRLQPKKTPWRCANGIDWRDTHQYLCQRCELLHGEALVLAWPERRK